MKSDLPETLRRHRRRVLEIAQQYGAHNLRLFGSHARGEADPDSDIDLLVDLESGRTLLDLGGLQYELEQLLGCKVDVVTVDGLKARIRERVIKEAIPL